MPQFDLQSILVTVLVLTLSLSVHEYAHARMAFYLGDDTAARMGRLTLNPLHHLDPIGTIVFLFARIGWAKPVPVNPSRFDRSKVKSMKTGMMLTSLAGPVSNLILAFIANILLQITFLIINLSLSKGGTLVSSTQTIFGLLISLFSAFYYSNIALAVFNLLPVPPLDGSKIFGGFLSNEMYYRVMQYERYIGLVFLALVLFGGSFISRIIYYVAVPFNYILKVPVDWLFEQLTRLLLG